MRMRGFGWATAGLVAVAAVVAVQEADAGGASVKLTRTTVREQSNAWRMMMTLGLPTTPPHAHTTFRFVFTPTAVYERSLVDGDKIVVNKQPLVNQTPLIETMEVDFADASGKIWKTTKFDFSLTRERGYLAGEYKLQVKGPGGDVGSSVGVTLEGDNPVVDRRSMDFTKRPTDAKPLWDGGVESGIKSL